MHASSDETELGTRDALRKLWSCVAIVVALAGLTYSHPDFLRFRPWVTGEGVPIARMFSGQQAIPGFAEAGKGAGSSPVGEQLPESIGALLASTSESPMDSRASRLTLESPGLLLAPSPGDTTEPPRADVGPAVRIEPEEFAGISQTIENPDALIPFFRVLKRTALARPGAIARVAHYGDSSVAADAITRTARRKLQQRFGDSGHGFILISRGKMHYAHADIQHRSNDGWNMLSATRSQLSSGYYGYGGVQARGKPGAFATFATTGEDEGVGTHVSRFELYFQRFKRGGRIRLRVDNDKSSEEVVDTRLETREDGFVSLSVPDGSHSLSLKVIGGRGVRLYGVALERDTPGVVYDSLGLVGARAQRLLNLRASHVAEQIAHRAPHLLVLGFGGNEAGNKWLNLERYEEELRAVIERMRAGRPEMGCLLFGPLDQGERNVRGRVVTIDKLPQIVEVQRRVALDVGCGFFDTYTAMGGKGSMGRWVRSRPKLASSDLRHATPEGYRVVGALYYKALLKAFADWL